MHIFTGRTASTPPAKMCNQAEPDPHKAAPSIQLTSGQVPSTPAPAHESGATNDRVALLISSEPTLEARLPPCATGRDEDAGGEQVYGSEEHQSGHPPKKIETATSKERGKD